MPIRERPRLNSMVRSKILPNIRFPNQPLDYITSEVPVSLLAFAAALGVVRLVAELGGEVADELAGGETGLDGLTAARRAKSRSGAAQGSRCRP